MICMFWPGAALVNARSSLRPCADTNYVRGFQYSKELLGIQVADVIAGFVPAFQLIDWSTRWNGVTGMTYVAPRPRCEH